MKTLRDLFDITVHPTCAWPRHLDVPLYVMGAGAGTAWLTLFHTCIEPGAAVDVARSEVVLDAVLVVAFLLLALLARRCSPYARRPSVIALVCVATMAGTAISVLGAGSPLLFLLGGGAAMMGIALSILLWDEFYSCLSPARIALYVSCSALAGEVFRVVLLGFNPTYLAVGMALLPLVSTLALVRAFRSLTADELPQGTTTATARAVPWTLIAVVAAYALCYGLVAKTSESSVALTVISKPLPALIIIASIVLQSERFTFNDVYRLGMPLAICGGALFCAFQSMDPTIANFFVTFGLFTCRILATVGIGNLARTTGVSPSHLFGIQNSARYAATLAGKTLQLPQIQAALPGSVYGTLTLASCFLTAGIALLFMRRRGRDVALWGLGVAGGAPMSERAAAALRIQRAGERFGLSDRELEILRLLLEDKTLAQIGRELCIAEGTVKSHANRIYRKAQVSGRKELAAAVAAVEETT